MTRATAAVAALALAGVHSDWARFGFDAARHDAAPTTGITAANVAKLQRHVFPLDGTVDSSPIYLHGVDVGGATHDVFFVTTTYGKTEALDADTGAVLWRRTPATYAGYAGGDQLTTASPVADPSRTAIYAAAPDGTVTKLRVADGSVVWSTPVTLDPAHEKLTASLNLSRGLVIATTGGYIGDLPPYQGHLVTLHADTGAVAHVFNALCSDRHRLLRSGECPDDGAAMWARSGAAVDPATGNLVVATGNGLFDGKRSWGDSLLVLAPDGSKLLRHWTPRNQEHLNEFDLDLGASGPGLLAGGYVVQGGKDRRLHLVSPALREVQTVAAPGGGPMWTVPAVWRGMWVFAATFAGTEALRLRDGRLVRVWANRRGGSSPVVAGDLVYVAGDGALNVYAATTGKLVAQLPYGSFHWQTPIVVDGRVALADGDNNAHRLDGELNVYTLR